jgi:hypothetical protein
MRILLLDRHSTFWINAVIVDPVRNCEISLQRALQEIQTASDTSRLAHPYKDGKNTLTSVLMRGDVQPSTDA